VSGRKQQAREVRERVRRLKNKFRSLTRVELLHEYVRYERALDGELPHPFPNAYVTEVFMALDDLVNETFDSDWPKANRFLDIVRKRPSRPFI